MRRPALSLVAASAVLLGARLPGARTCAWATAALRASRTTRCQAGPARAGARLPDGRDRPGRHRHRRLRRRTPPAEGGLTRLRAELSSGPRLRHPLFTVENGPGIAVAFLPLSVEPTSERASGRYRPPARRVRTARVRIDNEQRLRRRRAGSGARLVRGRHQLAADRDRVRARTELRAAAGGVPIDHDPPDRDRRQPAVRRRRLRDARPRLPDGIGVDFLGFTQVERIDAWVPIFLFCVLFGLSMDYQVFLLGLIHERSRDHHDTPGAIVYGVRPPRDSSPAPRRSRRRLHRLRHRPARRLPGNGVCIAIALALDATLMHLLLIPAAMCLFGERDWYLPRWLDWLPDLQVEGHRPQGAWGRPTN